jgi:hypothetical protein
MKHRAMPILTLSLVVGALLVACGATTTPSAPNAATTPLTSAPTSSVAAGAATRSELPQVNPAAIEGAIGQLVSLDANTIWYLSLGIVDQSVKVLAIDTNTRPAVATTRNTPPHERLRDRAPLFL